MSPTSLSISTGNHLTTRRTRFPFHNTVIPLISDIDSLIIINIQTPWVRELIDSISFFISSSHTEEEISGALDTIEKACRTSKDMSRGAAANDRHSAG